MSRLLDQMREAVRTRHYSIRTGEAYSRSRPRVHPFLRQAREGLCHGSFATHMSESVYDIRTLQGLAGHASVETTRSYTHVLNRGGRGVKSPLDED